MLIIIKFKSTMDKMNKDPKCSTEGKQFTYKDSRTGRTSNFSIVTLKVKR